jgi:hypothetical protein
MRTIYSQAALVVAWLGVQDDHTAQWMTALDEISHADSTADTKFDIDVTENEHAIKKFCSHVYWSRAWILQEFVLAHRINLWCGKHRATHETLKRLCNYSTLLAKLYDSPGIWTSPGMRVLQHRFEWHQACASGHGPEFPLEKVVMNFEHAQCQEPRDHVFALLSLCDRVELRFWPVLPDYTISTKELFTRLVNRAQLSDSYKRSRKDLSDFLLDYALCLKRILEIGDGGRSSAMLLPYT